LQLLEQSTITREIYDLTLKAMTQHVIDLDGKFRPQTRGQLMGSILSFPILCIVNASILRYSLELLEERTLLIEDCPFTVNGDDAVVRARSGFFDIWVQVAKICGLSPSVGKVYDSDTFLNMNSREFRLVNREFIQTPYINMGIMLNLSRSAGLGAKSSDFRPYGSLARELISSCPKQLRSRVLGQFIFRNRRKLARGIPYFLPEHLGGLGFPSLPDFQSSNSDASYVPSILGKLPSRSLSAGWKCRLYAQSRLGSFKNLGVTRYTISENAVPEAQVLSVEEVLGKLSVEAIFRAKNISEIYDNTVGDVFFRVPKVSPGLRPTMVAPSKNACPCSYT